LRHSNVALLVGQTSRSLQRRQPSQLLSTHTHACIYICTHTYTLIYGALTLSLTSMHTETRICTHELSLAKNRQKQSLFLFLSLSLTS